MNTSPSSLTKSPLLPTPAMHHSLTPALSHHATYTKPRPKCICVTSQTDSSPSFCTPNACTSSCGSSTSTSPSSYTATQCTTCRHKCVSALCLSHSCCVTALSHTSALCLVSYYLLANHEQNTSFRAQTTKHTECKDAAGLPRSLDEGHAAVKRPPVRQ